MTPPAAALSAAQAKLRLAARMLIEWKTPKDSPDYRRVFKDLIRSHSLANQLGIEHKTALLELDDNNVILWYLSESMVFCGEDSVTESSDVDPDQLSDYTYYVVSDLLSIGAVHEPGKTVWSGGPTRAKVADAILQAISSQERHQVILGFTSYLALQTSLRSTNVRKAVGLLMAITGRGRNVIQRLARLVDVSQSSIRYFMLALMILSFPIAFIVLFRASQGGTVFTDSLLVDVLAFALTILATLSTWRSSEASQREMLLEFFLNVRAVTAVFQDVRRGGQISIWRLVLRSVYRDAATFSKSLMSGLRGLTSSRRANPAMAPQVSSYRMRYDRVRSQLIRADLSFGIGFACGTTPGLMASLMKEPNQRRIWGKLAMMWTSDAIAEVVREVIHILQLPELDESDREAVFRWLCTVNVLVEPYGIG